MSLGDIKREKQGENKILNVMTTGRRIPQVCEFGLFAMFAVCSVMHRQFELIFARTALLQYLFASTLLKEFLWPR